MTDTTFGFMIGGSRHGEATITPTSAERLLIHAETHENLFYCDDATAPLDIPSSPPTELYTRVKVRLRTKDDKDVYVWTCGPHVFHTLHGLEGLEALVQTQTMLELCIVHFEEEYEQACNENEKS